MITAIKAELRKLFTVRSTYVLTIFALGLTLLIDFWAVGYKATGKIAHDYVQTAVFDSLVGVGVFAGVVGILLVTHEYRYNTIYYALTGTTNRLKFLGAKYIAILAYTVVFALAVIALAVLAVLIGLHMGDRQMPAQTLQWGKMLGFGLLYLFGMASFGFVFASLIRNQIGTLVAFFVAPGTIEGLASLVLKQRTAYLPFTALGNTISNVPNLYISRVESALVVLAWLVVGWTIAAILFVKRDAN